MRIDERVRARVLGPAERLSREEGRLGDEDVFLFMERERVEAPICDAHRADGAIDIERSNANEEIGARAEIEVKDELGTNRGEGG